MVRKPARLKSGFALPSFLIGLVTGWISLLLFWGYGTFFEDTTSAVLENLPSIENQEANIAFTFYEELAKSTDIKPPPIDIDKQREIADVRSNVAAQANTRTDQASSSKTSANVRHEHDEQVTHSVQVSDNQSSEGLFSYVLQCGSFKERHRADSMRAKLLLNGYRALTTTVELPNTQKTYRVIVGPYPSRKASEKDARSLKGDGIVALLFKIKFDAD